MVDPSIDPYFDKIFMVGDDLYWYMPLHAYRLHSRPCSKKEFFRRRVLYYFVLVSQLVLIFLELRNFIEAVLNRDFMVCVSLTVWFLLALNAFQLMYFTRNNAPDLIELIKLMHDDFPKSPEDRKRIDMDEVVKEWQRNMGTLVWIYKFTISGLCFAPMLNSVILYITDGIWLNQLPLFLWYPFDARAMPIYPFIFLLEIWFFYINTYVVMAHSIVFGEFTMVTCMQFKSVAANCRKLQFSGNFERDLSVIEPVIKEHNRALYIAHRMQDLFSLNLLFIYTTAATIFCIFLFLTLNESRLSVALQYIYTLAAYFCYNYVFAYFGDMMIQNSTSVAPAIYDSDWSAADVRIQKLIVVIIRRASSSVFFSGMGFFECSFPTMSKILGSAYSYFTLLRASYNKA